MAGGPERVARANVWRTNSPIPSSRRPRASGSPRSPARFPASQDPNTWALSANPPSPALCSHPSDQHRADQHRANPQLPAQLHAEAAAQEHLLQPAAGYLRRLSASWAGREPGDRRLVQAVVDTCLPSPGQGGLPSQAATLHTHLLLCVSLDSFIFLFSSFFMSCCIFLWETH